MRTVRFLVIVIGLIFSNVIYAGDPAAGEKKSAACAACHGARGNSTNPLWPNLAGQNAAYLEKQMKDYRDGRRQDPIMASMATALSDTDIADLAAYYAGQQQK